MECYSNFYLVFVKIRYKKQGVSQIEMETMICEYPSNASAIVLFSQYLYNDIFGGM